MDTGSHEESPLRPIHEPGRLSTLAAQLKNARRCGMGRAFFGDWSARCENPGVPFSSAHHRAKAAVLPRWLATEAALRPFCHLGTVLERSLEARMDLRVGCFVGPDCAGLEAYGQNLPGLSRA